jgi:hypothetical protein
MIFSDIYNYTLEISKTWRVNCLIHDDDNSV